MANNNREIEQQIEALKEEQQQLEMRLKEIDVEIEKLEKESGRLTKKYMSDMTTLTGKYLASLTQIYCESDIQDYRRIPSNIQLIVNRKEVEKVRDSYIQDAMEGKLSVEELKKVLLEIHHELETNPEIIAKKEENKMIWERNFGYVEEKKVEEKLDMSIETIRDAVISLMALEVVNGHEKNNRWKYFGMFLPHVMEMFEDEKEDIFLQMEKRVKKLRNRTIELNKKEISKYLRAVNEELKKDAE